MQYLLFDERSLERVLGELKDAKPSFKRYRYVEVLAELEDGIVGKYRNTLFVLTKGDLTAEPVAKIVVEFSTDDGSFKPFAFGRYAYRDGKLLMDCEYREDVFHDYLPALLSELTVSRILIKDCSIRAEQLADKETEIVREVIKLSEEAKVAEPEKLEELSFEVSDLRTSFFTSFMHFKDTIEEIFSALSRGTAISSSTLGGLLSEQIQELRLELETLSYYESRFEQTLSGVRDALNVVHLRLEMLRGKENLELQKRTSALQAAAAIIEFVAVYYYTLKIWESFLPVKNLPPYLSFTLLAIFTTLVVIYTDALGEYIRERRIGAKFAILTILLLITLVMMALLPTLKV